MSRSEEARSTVPTHVKKQHIDPSDFPQIFSFPSHDTIPLYTTASAPTTKPSRPTAAPRTGPGPNATTDPAAELLDAADEIALPAALVAEDRTEPAPLVRLEMALPPALVSEESTDDAADTAVPVRDVAPETSQRNIIRK